MQQQVHQTLDSPEVDWTAIAVAAADRAPAKLRFDRMHVLLGWLQSIGDRQAPMQWISWYELLFAFQVATQEWGVESTLAHNTWRMYAHTHEYDLKQTCRSWSAYLLQLIRFGDPWIQGCSQSPLQYTLPMLDDGNSNAPFPSGLPIPFDHGSKASMQINLFAASPSCTVCRWRPWM